MSSKKIQFVYWIHLPEHTDILTEGYVGVSVNPKRRLQEHKNSTDNKYLARVLTKYPDDVIQSIVFEGDADACYGYEEQLRPKVNIGWNNNKGGICPPSKTGWVPTQATLDKRSKSLKGIARTEEWCKNLSEGHTGEKNGMFGRKNPCSEDRQLSICKAKNKNKIEDYKLALEMMKQGKSNRTIARELGINLASTCQLKNGTHLVFKAFPELIQPLAS